MMTTARPVSSTRVVATCFPSGDQAGNPYAPIPASETSTVSPAASMSEIVEPSRDRRASVPADARRPTGPGVVAVVGVALSTGALAPGEGSSAARVGWAVGGDGDGAGAQAAAAPTATISAATTDARAHNEEVPIRTRYARVFVADRYR
jgi:hypothetical protein